MKVKVFKKVLALVIISFTVYSCSSETPNTVNSSSVSESQVNAKFVADFEPKPKAGQKIVYISSSPGNQSRELTTEIIAVDGDVVTVKVTDAEGSKELKGKNEDFKDDLPQTGITLEGTEDVKVPAGEFKGATKVSFTNATNTKVILWLAQGTGPIKRIDTLANGLVITTELKEFKN